MRFWLCELPAEYRRSRTAGRGRRKKKLAPLASTPERENAVGRSESLGGTTDPGERPKNGAPRAPKERESTVRAWWCRAPGEMQVDQ